MFDCISNRCINWEGKLMGSFDTLHITCPNCGKIHPVQSKAGKCMMHDYTPQDAPLAIIAEFAGEHIQCENCDTIYRVSVQHFVQIIPTAMPALCITGNCDE